VRKLLVPGAALLGGVILAVSAPLWRGAAHAGQAVPRTGMALIAHADSSPLPCVEPSPSPSPTVSPAAGQASPAPSAAPATPSPAASASPCGSGCPTVDVNAPLSMNGLGVDREDACADFKNASGRLAIDRLTLLGIRQPRQQQLLMATLEIAHFVAAAPLDQPSFQAGILDSIGAVKPQQLLVGDEVANVSKAPGLLIASWFRGRYLFILVIRDTYDQPKSLLRAAMKVTA